MAESGFNRSLKTVYCDIYYNDQNELSDFFWRISGKRLDFSEELGLARSRVDRLVERVQMVLDMYPRRFRVKIYLYPEYEKGLIARYEAKGNIITVYSDKVTDGILAHELAHAVINTYFEVSPPEKAQEILARYVDKHLWEDY